MALRKALTVHNSRLRLIAVSLMCSMGITLRLLMLYIFYLSHTVFPIYADSCRQNRIKVLIALFSLQTYRLYTGGQIYEGLLKGLSCLFNVH